MDERIADQAPVLRAGALRAEALAASRRRLTAEQLQSAEAADARRAEEAADFRETTARAVGADTRVSIMRAPSAPIFLYRAIDEETGEVVFAWPHLEFLGLSGALAAADPAAAGKVVDSKA